MPAQSILIAKVLGVSANEILKRFKDWSAGRQFEDSNTFEPSQWPDDARQEMDQFVEALQVNRFDPAVAYFDEYVDQWSSPATRWLADFPGLIEVCSDKHELACYPLPDNSRLQETLEGLRRNIHPEDHWFAAHALEGVRAADWLQSSAAFLVIRTVVGPLLEDFEIQQATASLSEWLR